jgi:hypothetical protein
MTVSPPPFSNNQFLLTNIPGFDRNAHYAQFFRNALSSQAGGYLHRNFNNHVNAVIGAIWTHLSPIASLVNPTSPSKLVDVFASLHTLVTQAGLLSLHMRLDPHTVYHHEPVFKEDNFTSTRMEAFNIHHMRLHNPQAEEKDLPQIMDDLNITDEEIRERVINNEIARRRTLLKEEKKRARMDTALTQICILDGVTAYRVGGWETAQSNKSHPEYEKAEWKGMGVRARIITHGWVYCRWGRARSFPAIEDDEVGKRIHGARVWKKGGFQEFAAVKEVFDWAAAEQKEREKAVEAAKTARTTGQTQIVDDDLLEDEAQENTQDQFTFPGDEDDLPEDGYNFPRMRTTSKLLPRMRGTKQLSKLRWRRSSYRGRTRQSPRQHQRTPNSPHPRRAKQYRRNRER